MPRVFVVGSSFGAYHDMFRRYGWEIAKSYDEADLLQYTGGEDVSPSLYGRTKHPRSYINRERDMRERIIFLRALKDGKPQAGICRGGQFLNVMCGGSLWQDVNNHAIAGKHADVRS